MSYIGRTPTNAALTASDLADGIVGADKIASNAVTTVKINADAVTDAKIADDVVGTEHLTANEVDTAALGADAVTSAQLADDAVDSEHYTDGSIDTAHLADGQVTIGKLATAVLTGATDIGAAIVDADLLLIDDGAGGTLRKTAASRLKTYVGVPGMVFLTSGNITSTTSSINITGTHITSAHDHYQLRLRGRMAGDGIAFKMQFRDANGDLRTSGYSWKVKEMGVTNSQSLNNNDSQIELTDGHPIGNAANEGFNIIIDFLSPTSDKVPTMVQTRITSSNASNVFKYQIGAGRATDGTETSTGFLLYFANGGDFGADTDFQLYGFKKS